MLVDCPEDFGCKFLVSGNSVKSRAIIPPNLVLDALLRDFPEKLRSWLDRMLAFPKVYLLAWV